MYDMLATTARLCMLQHCCLSLQEHAVSTAPDRMRRGSDVALQIEALSGLAKLRVCATDRRNQHTHTHTTGDSLRALDTFADMRSGCRGMPVPAAHIRHRMQHE